jgi:hypothetical protein
MIHIATHRAARRSHVHDGRHCWSPSTGFAEELSIRFWPSLDRLRRPADLTPSSCARRNLLQRQKFTADDAIYSFTRLADPSGKWLYWRLGEIDSLTARPIRHDKLKRPHSSCWSTSPTSPPPSSTRRMSRRWAPISASRDLTVPARCAGELAAAQGTRAEAARCLQVGTDRRLCQQGAGEVPEDDLAHRRRKRRASPPCCRGRPISATGIRCRPSKP